MFLIYYILISSGCIFSFLSLLLLILIINLILNCHKNENNFYSQKSIILNQGLHEKSKNRWLCRIIKWTNIILILNSVFSSSESSYCKYFKSLYSLPTTLIHNSNHFLSSVNFGISGVNASLSSSEKNLLLSLHRATRKAVGATNMKALNWSSTLEAAAQEYAEECRGLNHSGVGGENLATATYDDVERLYKLWEAERDDFLEDDENRLHFPGSHVYGHYTQIVWASNTKVGCGYAYCDNQSQPYNLVCRYAIGNILTYKVYSFSESIDDDDETSVTSSRKSTTRKSTTTRKTSNTTSSQSTSNTNDTFNTKTNDTSLIYDDNGNINDPTGSGNIDENGNVINPKDTDENSVGVGVDLKPESDGNGGIIFVVVSGATAASGAFLLLYMKKRKPETYKKLCRQVSQQQKELTRITRHITSKVARSTTNISHTIGRKLTKNMRRTKSTMTLGRGRVGGDKFHFNFASKLKRSKSNNDIDVTLGHYGSLYEYKFGNNDSFTLHNTMENSKISNTNINSLTTTNSIYGSNDLTMNNEKKHSKFIFGSLSRGMKQHSNYRKLSCPQLDKTEQDKYYNNATDTIERMNNLDKYEEFIKHKETNMGYEYNHEEKINDNGIVNTNSNKMNSLRDRSYSLSSIASNSPVRNNNGVVLINTNVAPPPPLRHDTNIIRNINSTINQDSEDTPMITPRLVNASMKGSSDSEKSPYLIPKRSKSISSRHGDNANEKNKFITSSSLDRTSHSPRSHSPRSNSPRSHSPRSHSPRSHSPRSHSPLTPRTPRTPRTQQFSTSRASPQSPSPEIIRRCVQTPTLLYNNRSDISVEIDKRNYESDDDYTRYSNTYRKKNQSRSRSRSGSRNRSESRSRDRDRENNGNRNNRSRSRDRDNNENRSNRSRSRDRENNGNNNRYSPRSETGDKFRNREDHYMESNSSLNRIRRPENKKSSTSVLSRVDHRRSQSYSITIHHVNEDKEIENRKETPTKNSLNRIPYYKRNRYSHSSNANEIQKTPLNRCNRKENVVKDVNEYKMKIIDDFLDDY